MVEGTNPVWNPEETQKANGLSHGLNPLYRDEDKEFDDSESNDGDDVFIGVENQDDFKGYKDRYDVSLKGLENDHVLEPSQNTRSLGLEQFLGFGNVQFVL